MKDKDITVIVAEYNSAWVGEFEKIKGYLQTDSVLSGMQIEHVGSTSVVGLAAKPIIDIDIIVEPKQKPLVFRILCKLGYRHLGDLGIIGREAFCLDNLNGLMRHNLYLCLEDSLAVKNHLNWRNCLRSSVALCTEYAKLKKALAERYYNDPAGYCSAKTEFIIAGLAKFLSESELENIREQNTP